MMRRPLLRPFRVLLLIPAILLVSCQGPTGINGEDAPRQDVIAPEIRLIQPHAGDLITADTLLLEAELPDNPSDVTTIKFLVNGSSDLGNYIAVVTPPTLSYRIDLGAAQVEYGPVSVEAIAIDSAGNIGSSGVRLVNYVSPAHSLVLRAWKIQGTTETRPLSDTLTVRVDTTQHHYDVLGLGFMFPVPRDAFLDGVTLSLTQVTAKLPLSRLDLTLFSTDADSPDVALDTFRFTPDLLKLNSPCSLDLSLWRGDSSAWPLVGGSSMFLAFSPEDTSCGLGLDVTVRPRAYSQESWGDLWVFVRDVLGDSYWKRAIDLDTSAVAYPQSSILLH